MCRTGVACRIYPRLTVEGIDKQSCVIGKAVISVMLLHISGLDLCIALKGRGCFGDIFMTAYVGKRQYLPSVSGYLAEFTQLVLIICSKNKFFSFFSKK